MKHTMIDCYGSKNHSLENLVYINDTLNKIAYNLNLDSYFSFKRVLLC